jgi:hypothetical protein
MPADAATPGDADTSPGLKLHEICGRIGTNYDEARYALARGLLPSGIAAKPGRGRHRRFDPWQAFTLSILLKLKAAGVTTEAAQKIVEFAPTIQKQAVHLGYDFSFAPFVGRKNSKQRWYLDIGDGRYVRIVTNAVPGRSAGETSPWSDMQAGTKSPSTRPVVIFRINIARLAALLATPAH